MARVLLLWITGELPILRRSWLLRRTVAVDDARVNLRKKTVGEACQKTRKTTGKEKGVE